MEKAFLGLIWGAILARSPKDWEEHETSIRIAVPWAEIWTRDLAGVLPFNSEIDFNETRIRCIYYLN
jgi:hypothetical protein